MKRPRFSVESWSPEFGPPVEPMPPEGLSEVSVDHQVEFAAADWKPIDPPPCPADKIRFVDGVRRIDARIWIEQEKGLRPNQGLCASCAAGSVLCADRAVVDSLKVERILVSSGKTFNLVAGPHRYRSRVAASDSTEDLTRSLQENLRRLEIETAKTVSGADLIVIDGPLRGRDQVEGAVGYIKTHRVEYLPEEVRSTVAELQPGQRTPLFVTQTGWSRYCWYSRLPGGSGHPWSGIVRAELPASLTTREAIESADRVSAQLPRFASTTYKDPRAPQNLYPIAGLERELRRHLGDQQLLYRRLCRSASAAPAAGLQ